MENKISIGTEPFLKRIEIFLEDGNWKSADEYCERVLDMEPECAQAYLYKLMVSLKIKKIENLAHCDPDFEENLFYLRAMKYADSDLSSKLAHYATEAKNNQVLEINSKKLNNLINQFTVADTEATFLSLSESFKELSGFENADEYSVKSLEKANECKTKASYLTAKALMAKNTLKGYDDAISMFEEIPDYSDSKELIEKCNEEKIRLEKTLAEEKVIQEKLEKKSRKRGLIILAFVCIFLLVAIGYSTFIKPAQEYDKAKDYISDDMFLEACEVLIQLNDYKDSKALLQEHIMKAVDELAEQKDYNKAITYYKMYDGFDKSSNTYKDLQYNYAKQLIDEEKYSQAISILEDYESYKNCKTLLKEAKYGYILQNKNSTDQLTASYLTELKRSNYKDTKSIFKSLYQFSYSIVANTNENDHFYEANSFSKYDKWYFHIHVYCEDNDYAGVQLSYRITYPNGNKSKKSWDGEWYHNNNGGGASAWYDNAFYGKNGNLKFELIDEFGRVVATKNIWINSY